MSVTVPEWLQRIFGIPSRPGEGMQWTFEHVWPWPAWLTILLVVGLGALFISLYWRENHSVGRRSRLVLSVFRLILLGLVLWMIAQVSLVVQRTGLPPLVLLIDNSGSMSTVDSYEKSQMESFPRRLKEAGLPENLFSRLNLAKMLLLENEAAWLKELHRDYQLRIYVLEDSGAGVQAWDPLPVEELQNRLRRLEPEVPSTRLGSAVQTIFRQLRGMNPAAVVLLTDGITTEGPPLSEAAPLARRRGVPLWILGLGETRALKNIKLVDVLVEPVVFLGDLVPFECQVSAGGLEGQRVRLLLREEGKPQILAQTEVLLGRDHEVQTVRLFYRPSQEGTFRYQLQLEPLEEEITQADNQRTCLVQVRKEQIHVLLAYSQPDFEFRYLANLLRRDGTIDLHTWLQEADSEYVGQTPGALRIFPVRAEDLSAYDVVILGDVPPGALGTAALEALAHFVQDPLKGGAIIFIAGPRGWMPQAYRGTPLEGLFPFDLSRVRMPAPEQAEQESFVVEPSELGFLSPSMQLAETPGENRQMWSRLSPLRWLLEIDQVRPGVRVLAEHPTRTGPSGQRLPVILFQYVGAGQVVFHATDETWRWRWRVGDRLLARYWIQTLRTLSRAKLAQAARWAELTTDRRQYQWGEPVRVRVVFGDPRQAPEEDQAVQVVLEHRQGSTQRVELHRTALGRAIFEAVLPSLPLGEYRAWLSTPSGEGMAPSTEFQVTASPGERSRLQVDVEELRRSAQLSQGRFTTLADARRFFAELPKGHQVPLETLPPIPLWNRWPLLALFLALLIAEWILRKFHGMV